MVGQEGWVASATGWVLNQLENAGNEISRDKVLRGYVSCFSESELCLVSVSAGRYGGYDMFLTHMKNRLDIRKDF